MVTTMPGELTHSYAPQGGCREAFITRHPEVLLSGPAGTGKSRALLERLMIMALRYPGMRGLIVRKTLASLGSTALVTWREHVAREAIATGIIRYYGGSAEEPPQYRFTNGSKIMIGGMDKPTRIMSSEYDVAYVQEAVELNTEDWEAITTRLRNGKIPYQQIIADTNPDTPTHWLKIRGNLGTTKIIESRHEDNPTLFTAAGQLTERGAAYIGKLDALTGVRKQRLRHGLWVAAEGMIYEEFDPAVHVIDRFPVPKEWSRYWSVDFGYTNPFVWQSWAIDPDGVAYLTDEIYMTRRTVDQHAAKILSIVTRGTGPVKGRTWVQAKPRAIICDHDAEGRAVLERELGMSTQAAYKVVTEGIQAVQVAMRDKGNGRRGIYLMRDTLAERDGELVDSKLPTCTAEELPGYVWDTGAGKATKEVPLKKDDHGCLIAGTLVATPSGPRPIEEFEPGDLVHTRTGPQMVTAAGQTALSAPVFEVTFSDGRTLTGTGNHPVWVAGSWIRMDALRYSDRVEVWPMSSPSTASATAGTRRPDTSVCAPTTPRALRTGKQASSTSTSRSGSTPTTWGSSRPATRSTMQTSTRSTTTPTISSASRSLSTRKLTASRAASAGGRPRWLRTSTGSDPLQLPGIPARQGSHGTRPTPLPGDSDAAGYGLWPASTAAAPTRPTPPTARAGSALTAARLRPGKHPASTTSRGRVPDAGHSSRSTATRSGNSAPVHVLSVRAVGHEPVWNLTVCGSPEYYANGVLVHNCDALRYLAVELTQGRPRVRVM